VKSDLSITFVYPARPMRLFLLGWTVLSLGACRGYTYDSHIASQGGLLPADVYARYGREQAISVALGREFARPYNSGPATQVDVVTNYARAKFPDDVTGILADAQGSLLTVTFKSGWRSTVVPINDGKTGDQTAIPGAQAGAQPAR